MQLVLAVIMRFSVAASDSLLSILETIAAQRNLPVNRLPPLACSPYREMCLTCGTHSTASIGNSIAEQ